MAAFTNAQVQSLPDIISIDRFVMNFGAVPGTGNTLIPLSLKCIDAVIPGFGNQAFEVRVSGNQRNFRGQKMYQYIGQFTFVETVDLSALKTFRNWHEFVVGTNSGNSGGYIAQYAVNAVQQVYDTTGALADNATFYRMFPVEINDIQTNSSQSQAMMISAQMRFDYPVFANATPQ